MSRTISVNADLYKQMAENAKRDLALLPRWLMAGYGVYDERKS